MNRAWAIVAALAFLATAGMAQPTPPPPPTDLAVVSLGLAPGAPVPSWTDGVGAGTQVQAVVANHGSVDLAYRLDYFWRGAAGRVPLNGVPEQSFDLARSPLAAGDERIETFPWRLQAGQEGAGFLEVEVEATPVDGGSEQRADRTPGDNLRAREVFVRTRSFTLTADPQEASIEAGATGFLRVDLRNDGNEPEAVALSLAAQATDARLQAQLGATIVQVPARTTVAAPVFVSFDPEGDFSPFSQRYTVLADPGFGGARSVVTAAATPAEPTPPGQHAFTLTRLGAAEVVASPSVPTSLQFEVNNTGQRSDVFLASLVAPDGWAATVTPARVGLHPGEAALVTLRVQPSAGTPAGSRWDLALTLSPTAAAGAQSLAVQVRASGPSPTLEAIDLPPAVYVGMPAKVEVRLRNPGDAVPAQSSLALVVRSPGSPETTLHSALGPVAAGASAKAGFTLAAPLSGGALTLHATWSGTGSPDAVLATQAQVHDVVLRVIAPAPAAGSPGESVAYRTGALAFRVSNAGNAAEDVQLSVAAQGRAAIEGDSKVRLAPGESWIVAVRHDLPMPAGAATQANVTLTASAGPVRVTNGTATRVVDVTAPTLDPATLPPLWNAGAAMPLAVAVHDDGEVRRANATVVSPSGARAVVPLERGADGLHRGAILLAERGNHTIRFAAVDRMGNVAHSTAQKVDATTLPPPTLLLEGVGEGGELEGRVLRVRVDSLLDVAQVHVVLRQGDREELRDLQVTDGAAAIALEGFQAGAVQVNVTGRDLSGSLGMVQAQVVLPAAPASDTGTDASPRDAPAPLWVVFAALAALARRRGQ